MENLYQKLPVLEPEGQAFDRLTRLKAMNGPLLAWYGEHARILPWRENPEAYRVWISEIMLQQTRVEAVKPYFQRFLSALPHVKALAEVPEDQLLKLWEGLGYYNRARNLKKAAQIVVEEYGGILPSSYEELLKLPGIGSYTAGAVASIAYGIPVPAVDGNVLRVLSRVLESYDDILKQSTKRQMELMLAETMPRDQASAFNQGLIEIGAIVCVPNGAPKCSGCPLQSVCLTSRKGLWDTIPVKARSKPRRIEEKTILLFEVGDRIAIQKRPDTGLLASLYEFPSAEGHLTPEEVSWEVMRLLGEESAASREMEIQPAGTAKHIFSHVEWHMTGYRIKLKAGSCPFLLAERQELRDRYPIPNAFLAYTKQILGEF